MRRQRRQRLSHGLMLRAKTRQSCGWSKHVLRFATSFLIVAVCITNFFILPRVGRDLSSVHNHALYAQPNGISLLDSNQNKEPVETVGTSLQLQASSSANELDIFYNIFIPTPNATHDNNSNVSKAIVEEQIQQIWEAFVESPTSIKVNYVSIGQSSDQLIQDACHENKLKCRQITHYEEGFEEKTLQEVWNHCQWHPLGRVAYIHNKGSLHPDKYSFINQHVWRRAGTRAALSPECAKGIAHTCNFCGLLVTPVPWLHLPGNFWMAKCSYIQQLMPPHAYQDALDDYVHKIAEPYLLNRTMNMLFQDGHRRGPTFFGQSRFAAENWIGSHPSAQPCDVSSVPYIQYWQTPKDPLDAFNLSVAPRRDLRYMMDKANPRIPPYILDRKHLRKRDYHLLGGMITRWLHFYQQIPPPTSWFWSYYPDATRWQKAAKKYGTLAFQKVAANVRPVSKKTQRTQRNGTTTN